MQIRFTLRRMQYGDKFFLRNEQFTFRAKICIIYREAVTRSSVAQTAASIVLYICLLYTSDAADE